MAGRAAHSAGAAQIVAGATPPAHAGPRPKDRGGLVCVPAVKTKIITFLQYFGENMDLWI